MKTLSGTAHDRAGGRIKTALAIAAALACLPGQGAASAGPALEPEAQSVSLSLDGSFDKYGESSSEELRAGLEFECVSGLKLGSSALDWNLELYYDYSRSDTDGAVTNANSVGLDLAKLLLSRWRGTELKTLKPYLLAGVELTRLKEPDPDEEGETISSRFLSPAVGLGVELRLNRRASFNVEYRQNLAGGLRRISGITLGLTYAIFGEGEEGDEGEKDK